MTRFFDQQVEYVTEGEDECAQDCPIEKVAEVREINFVEERFCGHVHEIKRIAPESCPFQKSVRRMGAIERDFTSQPKKRDEGENVQRPGKSDWRVVAKPQNDANHSGQIQREPPCPDAEACD